MKTKMSALTLILALSLLAGCGSDNPAAPDDTGNDWQDQWPDLPHVDADTSPQDLPLKSEAIVRIEAYDGPFAPVLNDVWGDWTIMVFGGITGTQHQGWASDPVFDGIGGVFRDGQDLRFDLAADGGFLPVVEGAEFKGAPFSEDNPLRYEWAHDNELYTVRLGYKVARYAAPHLKRETYWERVEMNGTDDFAILEPTEVYTSQTSVTTGVERAESYEFMRSITVSAGGSYGGFGASVEATLSETFGSSVSVYADTTFTQSRTFEAPQDKGLIITAWKLVERYTFCDENGDPLAYDHFRFREPVFENALTTRYSIDPWDAD